MPRLHAVRKLRRAQDGDIRLTPQGWYELTELVTGDKAAAEKAHNDAIRREQP